MKTYKEHYKACINKNPIININAKYNSVYDLAVDRDILNPIIDDNYFNLIKNIRLKINKKINSMDGCFIDKTGHAIRVNEWKDITEIQQLINSFIPIIENNIFKCPAKVEFLHPYKNIQNNEGTNNIIPQNVNSSWKWHYDDCPDEFIKLFIYLNDVTEFNGCLKYIEDKNQNIIKLKTFREPNIPNKQIFPGSRIPESVINQIINEGGKVVNVTGKAGSYAIHSANIMHRASCPQPGTDPRDVLFFFIRPSLKKQDNKLKNIHSYLPEKDVKHYEFD